MLAYYALLPSDPSTMAHIAVITAESLGDASLTIDGRTITSAGQQLPDRSERIYHFQVNGLFPLTEYVWSFEGQTAEHKVRTLPGAMPRGGITVTVASDLHIEANVSSMASPEEMDIIAAQSPDVMLLTGDLANTFRETFGSSNGGWWVKLATDYLTRISTDHLVPILVSPGNHDVGNHQWDGTGEIPQDGTYFQFFFPNAFNITGHNYAAITCGDYLQLLNIDTHSTTVSDTAEWAPGAIDPNIPFCLPFHHSPLFAADIRGSNDPQLQAYLREALFESFFEAENIKFGVCGHIHTRTLSKPLGVVDVQPASEDYLTLGSRWIVEVEGGHLEVGQGYRTGRGGGNQLPWFLQQANNNQKNFQVVSVNRGSVTLDVLLDTGQSTFTNTWVTSKSPRVQQYGAHGAAVTARGYTGSPVYPVSH